MLGKRAADKSKIVDQKVKNINEKHKSEELSVSLDQNMAVLRALFTDVDILRLKIIQNSQYKELRFGIAFCDGVVNPAIINDNILRPLMISNAAAPGPSLLDTLQNQVIQINEAEQTANFIEIIEAVCYGETVLFAEGIAKALILDTKSFITRASEEPENEKILSGPREGFIESLTQNISFVRRRMRTNELKIKYLSIGTQTQTSVCVCYLNGVQTRKLWMRYSAGFQRSILTPFWTAITFRN
jgi:spore germination protein KA